MAFFVVLLGSGMVSCGGSGGSTGTSSTHTLSGTITGAANVTVRLRGDTTAIASTDSSGNYRFSVTDGQYTITPSLTGYTLTPASITVTIDGTDVTNQNFTATPNAHTVSGTVTGPPGITMTLSGDAAAVTITDNAGFYSFAVNNGNYTISPSLTGYTLSPASRAAVVAGTDVTNLDFTATQNFYTLSGTITGVTGVTVSLGGDTVDSTTTDNLGYYSFTVADGSYTLTPALSGYSFSPATLLQTVSGSDVTAQDFTVVPTAYSIAGTANYSGSGVGRIYIEVYDVNGGSTNYGTSINGPGAYTIRGVKPGTYNLVMHMDTLDYGISNRVNPRATAVDVVVQASDITGVNATLTDPATPVLPFAAVAAPGVSAGSGALIISWDSVFDAEPVGATGYLWREEFEQYRIHYYSDVALTNQVDSDDVAAGNNFFIKTGLTDGAVYYVTLSGLAQGIESAESDASQITVGAATGLNTVTGSVTFPTPDTGMLLVGLISETQGFFYDLVTAPVTPQNYSISGVPDGDYATIIAIDSNNNGVIDTGELFNGATGQFDHITINASSTVHNLLAQERNIDAGMLTVHWLAGQQQGYGLELDLYQGMKRPVSVALVAGPYISDIPIEISHTLSVDQPYYAYIPIGGIRPAVGDNYTFDIAYSDGSTEALTLSLSAVLDSFATPTYPISTDSGDTSPVFTWDAPTSPPAKYRYGLIINDDIGGVWERWNLPSNQTSVTYNDDGLATVQPTLVSGDAYYWSVNVIDAFGNTALNEVTYTP